MWPWYAQIAGKNDELLQKGEELRQMEKEVEKAQAQAAEVDELSAKLAYLKDQGACSERRGRRLCSVWRRSCDRRRNNWRKR